MTKVRAILDVDEDALRSMYDRDNHGEDYCLSNALESEMGWVAESGISLESFEVVEGTSKWNEIDNNYYDSEEGCICIDAWENFKGSEERKVIAKVYISKVVYLDEDAKEDTFAQEMISEAKKLIQNMVF